MPEMMIESIAALEASMQREENLQKLFEALMQLPDDVTMAEVRKTMKDALQSEHAIPETERRNI